MLFAQHHPPQPERLLVLAPLSQHICQVDHAPQCGWMLFAQYRLHQPEYLSKHLFRLLVLGLPPSASARSFSVDGRSSPSTVSISPSTYRSITSTCSHLPCPLSAQL